jgi:UDP-2,3-diacylglucosamine pyrophosphatase LpxH
MPAHFVAISDMHLGYERSILNDPAKQDHLVDAIADLCGGAADRLVLNGDCFEACVPQDAGQHDVAGFPPSVAAASRSFFRKFADKITCTSLVILWGNHDLCMWQRLAAACGAPVFTNDQKGDVLLQHDSCVLPGAEPFLTDVIGPGARYRFQRIRSAYPNYVLGHAWPYLAFHHGHLLDKLVLGWEPEVNYMALRALIGEGSPRVSRDGDETIASIHRKTAKFISAMWKWNSRARAEEWALLRRTDKIHVCPYYPIGGVEDSVESEMQGSQLGEQVKWYLDTLMMDSTTPGAIGPADSPGWLFVGHDHDGGRTDVPGLDGRNWKLVNLGGWTRDRDEKSPHTHVATWPEGANEPAVHCVAV